MYFHIHNRVKALLPALEKRYVNKVVFGVYDATKMEGDQLSADALLESYTFKFGSISEGDYIKVGSPRPYWITLAGRAPVALT